MIDYKYKNLFFDDSITKQVVIECGDIMITNEDLFNQEMTIEESLCSENELRFGACEAGMIKFKVANIFASMLGKRIIVKVIVESHVNEQFVIGSYTVESDKLTADRKWREITAYDAMYDIINSDVAAWYNSVLTEKDSKVTLKAFRESFIRHFGLIEVVPNGGLVNDNMVVEKTVDIVSSSETESETEQASVIGEALSGLDVITAICEINGCFGHIGRDGKFHYIYLPQTIQGLWPANDLYPADDLFPIEPKTSRIGGGTYIQVDYENFVTKEITKLQIRQEENDIGLIYGSGDNCYIIENNFLVYGKSSDELSVIAQNIYNKITGITYMPLISCEAIGNPCFEVGDPIRISTKYDLIETYILERNLKGIQGLRDTYKSNGVEEYGEKVNGVHSSILQLKGKANILTRTIEETKSTIIDVKKGLQTQITQNAESITLEAERAKETEKKINGALVKTNEELSSKIEVTAENITQSVDKKITETKEYADGKVEERAIQLSSKIDQTATNITSTVSATYETKTDSEEKRKTLDSKIDQTATNITSTVSATYETKTDSSNKYSTMSSEIQQTADKISTKVSKDGVISSINQSAEKIKIDASKVEIKGNAEITGGYIHIKTDKSSSNIIELSRDAAKVQIGNDGMNSEADTRRAVFMYSGIEMTNTASSPATSVRINPDEVCASSFGWASYSDARLKTDIEYLDAEERAKFIYSQMPCKFKYTYDSKSQYRHGLIAQNVKETIGNENWALCEENERSDGETYFTLNYTDLIADLIATLQSQNRRIEYLEKKVRKYE